MNRKHKIVIVSVIVVLLLFHMDFGNIRNRNQKEFHITSFYMRYSKIMLKRFFKPGRNNRRNTEG